MYYFSNLEPVHCSMSCSNCCFLTYIQVFQEAGKVVWYSHFFKNFPQFVVIHTVKDFSIVNEAELHFFFFEFSCFFCDPTDVCNLISYQEFLQLRTLNNIKQFLQDYFFSTFIKYFFLSSMNIQLCGEVSKNK